MNLVFEGQAIYSTGTISDITGGVNVTGSGTLWLANVTTDHQFFVGNKWYRIASVDTDTTLTLAEGYAGGATFPGAGYRTAKIRKDINIKELSFRNSTGTGIIFKDCRNIFIEDCEFLDNNKGFTIDNASDIAINNTNCISNDSNGVEFNSCSSCDIEGLATPSNGGHGCVINSVRLFSLISSSSDSNTSDGYNITDGSGPFLLQAEASSNSSQGIELVSGNTNLLFNNCQVNSNTSDGIKLTGTSDDTIITNSIIKSNGGYGINVAASTCDDTIIDNIRFASNTSGGVDDKGNNTFYKNTGVGAFTAVNNDNNNVDVGELRFIRITGPTIAFTISGIAGTANMKTVTLYNATSQNMAFSLQSTNSTYTNRIQTLTGGGITLTGASAATLTYNNTDKEWIVMGTQG